MLCQALVREPGDFFFSDASLYKIEGFFLYSFFFFYFQGGGVCNIGVACYSSLSTSTSAPASGGEGCLL